MPRGLAPLLLGGPCSLLDELDSVWGGSSAAPPGEGVKSRSSNAKKERQPSKPSKPSKLAGRGAKAGKAEQKSSSRDFFCQSQSHADTEKPKVNEKRVQVQEKEQWEDQQSKKKLRRAVLVPRQELHSNTGSQHQAQRQHKLSRWHDHGEASTQMARSRPDQSHSDQLDARFLALEARESQHPGKPKQATPRAVNSTSRSYEANAVSDRDPDERRNSSSNTSSSSSSSSSSQSSSSSSQDRSSLKRAAARAARRWQAARSRSRRRGGRSRPRDSSRREVPRRSRSGRAGGSRGRERKRISKWDVVVESPTAAAMPPPIPSTLMKKAKECYVGNLHPGTTAEAIAELLRRLFRALPSFLCAYGELDPIAGLHFPPAGRGGFAFVDFADEILTTTAIQMSGVELNGRKVRIGRPQGYICPPHLAVSPLDVKPLRDSGLLPIVPEVVEVNCPSSVAMNKLREIYIGNLLKGTATESMITELLLPILVELPTYVPENGPPITRTNIHPSGTYCFVQLQNMEMAHEVIEILNGINFLGRPLRVNRCHTSKEQGEARSQNGGGGGTQGGVSASGKQGDSEAFLAGAAAVASLNQL